MSTVEGCTVSGVREGIVTHMSMDRVSHNDVEGAHGVGILCVDHSECTSGDPTRAGVAIEAHYFAQAMLK